MASAFQDLFIVGSLVSVPQEQRLHARTRQRVSQLVGAIGGIYIDQGRAGPCATHVHHDPLHAVGGPQAHAIAMSNAKRPQTARHAVGRRAQFGPRHSLRLVTRSHGKAIGIKTCGPIKEAADCQLE